MLKIVALLLIFFVAYAVFWLKILPFQQISYKNPLSQASTSSSEKYNEEVIKKASSVESNNAPIEYVISVEPRKQAFNLSCEFAAAASIIHHFTKNPDYSTINEKKAEMLLLNEVGVSNNPNVGVRMGKLSEGDLGALLENLNQKFGGSDYYGVHAPPFIDLFAKHGLLAQPIEETNYLAEIKKAISENHLVMGWIKIGSNEAIDISLSYGLIPLVKGEHTVVVIGYTPTKLIIMDPASAQIKEVAQEEFLKASSSFSMPFLKISKPDKISFENTYVLGEDTIAPKKNLSVTVINGSRNISAATALSKILFEFGYKVSGIKTGESNNYVDLTIAIKKSYSDYLKQLEKDLKLAGYNIESSSTILPDEEQGEAKIIVGN